MCTNIFEKGKKASLHSKTNPKSKKTTSKSISFYDQNLEDLNQLKKVLGNYSSKDPNNSLVVRVAMRMLLQQVETEQVNEDELERLILEMV